MPKTNNDNILKTRTVYIISSLKTNKVYIGSTSEKLSTRLSKHKTNKDCRSNIIISLGDYKISPLCIVNNCTRKEISLKEKDYFIGFKDILVNLIDTKDSYNKNYKSHNSELSYIKFLNRLKETIICPVCNIELKRGSLYNHKKNKHLF